MQSEKFYRDNLSQLVSYRKSKEIMPVITPEIYKQLILEALYLNGGTATNKQIYKHVKPNIHEMYYKDYYGSPKFHHTVRSYLVLLRKENRITMIERGKYRIN